MSTTDQSNAPQSLPPETAYGMAISLLFWFCLLLAALFFAAVSLAPKLLDSLQLRSQFDRNQRQLVAMERQTEQLQRVIEAIQTDADFSAELTRSEFDAVLPGEEVIPVEMDLKLDLRSLETPALPPIQAVQEWFEPIVLRLASDTRLRNGFLGAAILLVIVSFTAFAPARTEDPFHPQGHDSLWGQFRKRYAR
jgi:cell division protein FtsB